MLDVVATIILGAGGGAAPRAAPVTQHLIPTITQPSMFLGYPGFWAFLHDWAPIMLMAVLVFAVLGLMRFMPRTSPERIKPDRAPTIGWSEIAGADEAKEELREIVDYQRPEEVPRHGRQGPEGRVAPRPAGHRQDPPGQGGRTRVWRHVLLAVRGLVRRDVRGSRRRAQ